MSKKLNGPVWIIEDDPNTASLIATYLKREGFEVEIINDGRKALELHQNRVLGFVILDVMLPEVDGWEICRALRKISDVPILMLSAREEEIDRVLGLSLGADDYVVKPFSPRELVERVKAILRRSTQGAKPTKHFRHDILELDLDKRKVLMEGVPVALTSVEYKLLQAFMSAPGKAFSREDLLSHIYQRGETVVDRVIDVHIGHLRQKLGDDPLSPRFIETVRGFGYRFAEAESR